MIAEGIVIARFKKNALVKNIKAEEISCVFKNRDINPLVGDQVRYLEENNTFIITDIAPRISEFSRINKKGEKEIIAVNITQLAIVISARPKPDWFLLDKYLSSSQINKFKTVIVFNKTDLGKPGKKILDLYRNIGYKVINTSAVNNDTENLLTELSNETSVLIGQSGVGKSSLINKLTNIKKQLIGDLSKKTNTGKHTTTSSKLFSLNNNGSIIDSPGVRNYAPYFNNTNDILSGFIEFRNFEENCRFINCTHLSEPDCSIKKAVADKKIDKRRYENFKKLFNQIDSIKNKF